MTFRKKRLAELPPGDVLVRVQYSSLNYKDALASEGHPGVARELPIVPGIDAVGEVVESASPEFAVGSQVLIANAQFGTAVWGGWSELARVSAEWLLPLPAGLSAREAMVYGTAGFTAAQCVDALLAHGVASEDGEVLVTGATGGVGVMAVGILSQLGFKVVASTGKQDRVEWLLENGAQRVVDRAECDDDTDRPLLGSRWAGVVDTVGGTILSTAVRSTQHGGCVTACGMVAGPELPLNVFPFILRGVTLQGIDSAGIDNRRRSEIWKRIAEEWRLPDVEKVATFIGLDGLNEAVERILAGGVTGRVVVEC